MLAHAAALFLAALPACLAAPTAVLGTGLASRTVPLSGVTHTVVAGLGGRLVFDPDNVVADAGDIVEWHFLAKNHSVAQSSFGEPCQPLLDITRSVGGADGGSSFTGFFSGFQPIAAPATQAPDVFQLVVEDASAPLWYYCAQTVGSHCQKGMAGVINQHFDSPNTLAAYKAAAALTEESVVPPEVQGGAVLPNPNPEGGF